MKTRSEIEKLYSQGVAHVCRSELKNAFDALGALLAEAGLWQCAERRSELEETYRTMLRYAMSGAPDPERNVLLLRLKRGVAELLDEVREALLVQLAGDYEYTKIHFRQKESSSSENFLQEFETSTKRLALCRAESVSLAERKCVLEQREALRRRLFEMFWLAEKYSEDDFSFLYQITENQSFEEQDKCLVISAVMLHALRVFSERETMFFLDCYESAASVSVRCRAVVALAVLAYCHAERLPFYADVFRRLKLKLSEPAFGGDFRLAALQLVQARDTERVTQKLSEEILPEIMKLQSRVSRQMSGNEDFMKNFSEKNPEWKQQMQDFLQVDDATGKVMEEFNNMQMSGADVYLSSFAHLKNYGFFDAVSNWFLPFGADYSELLDVFSNEKERTNIGLVLNGGYLCNSDKYSFCLSLARVSSDERKMLFMSMGAETEELEEVVKDKLETVSQMSVQTGSYVKDVYRFYKLFAKKRGMKDIFELSFDFSEVAWADELPFSAADWRALGEYYFANAHYDKALHIFQKIGESQNAGVELFQKIGYCHQAEQRIEQALENYAHADLLQPDNVWTLKKMAFCRRMLRQYDRAEALYKRLQNLLADDEDAMLNEGYCLMELQRYADALRILYKAEYAKPESRKALRAIAWCLFLDGKFGQAEKYAAKLTENSQNATDLMNAGHIKWALRKRSEALELYAQSANKRKGGTDELLADLAQDEPNLRAAGIADDEIMLMKEQLRYKTEKNGDDKTK